MSNVHSHDKYRLHFSFIEIFPLCDEKGRHAEVLTDSRPDEQPENIMLSAYYLR